MIGRPEAAKILPGERVATFSTEPYNWREDPDCYETAQAYSNAKEAGFSAPEPHGIKWKSPRSFMGILSTTFEGSTFVVAQGNESGDDIPDNRFQGQIAFNDPRISFGPKLHRSFRVSFIGREALCNSTSPDEKPPGTPLSPNMIIADRFTSIERLPQD